MTPISLPSSTPIALANAGIVVTSATTTTITTTGTRSGRMSVRE
jgi:hypothetical protein